MANENTPKLGLSIWAPDDPLTRAEFNADHQRLETALGALCQEELLEFTTTEAASSVDIPLGDIDWSRYRYVYLLQDITAHASGSTLHRLLLNGVASADQSGSYLQPGSAEIHNSASSVAYGITGQRQLLRFDVWHDPGSLVSFLWKSETQFGIGCSSQTTYSALRKLTITPVSGSVSYAAGATVQLWGVRG
jgi:hypothetical protein